MNTLPKDLENIIVDYKEQLELPEPIRVVVRYQGKLYKNEIRNYETDGWSVKLPKYKGNQYYSERYYKRMTQGTGELEDLPTLKE